jgi:hypothetical protein
MVVSHRIIMGVLVGMLALSSACDRPVPHAAPAVGTNSAPVSAIIENPAPELGSDPESADQPVPEVEVVEVPPEPVVGPPSAEIARIPKHSLRPKWPVGRRLVFEYHAVGGGRTSSAKSGLDTLNRAELKIVYGLTILPGELGGHEGVMEIRDLLIRIMEKDRTKLDFDSRQTGFTRNATVVALRQSIGSKFIYSWNGNGTLLKVIGMERLHASLKKQVPDAMWNSLAGYFSNQTLGKLMAIHRGLPERPKEIGEIWSQHEPVRTLSSGVGCTVQQAYTLRGRRGGKPDGAWEIAQEGRIEYRATGPDAVRHVVGAANDRSEGTIWYDPAVGIVREAKGSSEFNIGTATKGGGRLDSKLTETYRFRLLLIEGRAADGSG